MQGLIYGIVCMVLGILGFIYWWVDFFSIIRGILPLVLVLAGLLALSTGISMVKESSSASDEEDSEENNIKE